MTFAGVLVVVDFLKYLPTCPVQAEAILIVDFFFFICTDGLLWLLLWESLFRDSEEPAKSSIQLKVPLWVLVLCSLPGIGRVSQMSIKELLFGFDVRVVYTPM